MPKIDSITSLTKNDVIKLYELQASEMRARHDAIWKEVHHYTWLLSVVLVAPLAYYATIDDPSIAVYATLTLLTFISLTVTVFAIWIIRREADNFSYSSAKLTFYEQALGIPKLDGMDDDNSKRIASQASYSVDAQARSIRERGGIVNTVLNLFTIYGVIAASLCLFFLLQLIVRTALGQ